MNDQDKCVLCGKECAPLSICTKVTLSENLGKQPATLFLIPCLPDFRLTYPTNICIHCFYFLMDKITKDLCRMLVEIIKYPLEYHREEYDSD